MRVPRALPGARGALLSDRLAAWSRLGRLADDDADLAVRKQTLTLAATTITILATAWTAIYLALGLPQSAAIPFTYQVVSVASLVLFARTRRFDRFAASQLALMLVLSFALQWTLGKGWIMPSRLVRRRA